MRRFAALYQQLDSSTATGDKIAALKRYFADAPAADAAWGVYVLAGGKPRQVVPTASLRGLACSLAGIDDWLFEASYQAVGDLAETISLVLPNPAPMLMPTPMPTPIGAGDQAAALDPEDHDHHGLACWIEERLLPFARVTVPVVPWKAGFLIPSGELRPGVRSPEVWRFTPRR